MSPRSKKEYTETLRLRYKKATRHEKTITLDEFCATCGYHRKHAIRILRARKIINKQKATKKKGKLPIYQNDTIRKPIKKIWLKANLPCSKRLKAILSLWFQDMSRYLEKSPLIQSMP